MAVVTRRTTWLHRVLVTSAGVMCLGGFLGLSGGPLLADEASCRTGNSCNGSGGLGTCNYHVDVEDCVCQDPVEEWYSIHENCETPPAG